MRGTHPLDPRVLIAAALVVATGASAASEDPPDSKGTCPVDGICEQMPDDCDPLGDLGGGEDITTAVENCTPSGDSTTKG